LIDFVIFFTTETQRLQNKILFAFFILFLYLKIIFINAKAQSFLILIIDNYFCHKNFWETKLKPAFEKIKGKLIFE